MGKWKELYYGTPAKATVSPSVDLQKTWSWMVHWLENAKAYLAKTDQLWSAELWGWPAWTLWISAALKDHILPRLGFHCFCYSCMCDLLSVIAQWRFWVVDKWNAARPSYLKLAAARVDAIGYRFTTQTSLVFVDFWIKTQHLLL